MRISLNEIIDKLNAILIGRHGEARGHLVMKFDDMILLSDLEVSKEVEDVLIDLAHNLEYYVANPEDRKEDPGYYGDEELEAKINEALQKIDSLNKK